MVSAKKGEETVRRETEGKIERNIEKDCRVSGDEGLGKKNYVGDKKRY